MASPRELRLVMIGKTGSGKSDTGNKILGTKHFKASLGGSSVTKKCSYQKGFNIDREISIVDTPGLFDTEIGNEDTQAEIKRCVLLSSPGPHAILFVTRIGRYTNEERKTIDHFVKSFGKGMYKYLIVLFTGGDDLEAEEKSLAEFIAQSPPELKRVLSLAGNRCVVFNNREKNVDALEKQVGNLLRLVDQTVAANGGRWYSNKMYEDAEAEMRKVEEKNRRVAEAEKKAEIDKIKAECRDDWEQEVKKVETRHKNEMDNLREEHRKAIEAASRQGLFGTIGKFADIITGINWVLGKLQKN